MGVVSSSVSRSAVSSAATTDPPVLFRPIKRSVKTEEEKKSALPSIAQPLSPIAPITAITPITPITPILAAPLFQWHESSFSTFNATAGAPIKLPFTGNIDEVAVVNMPEGYEFCLLVGPKEYSSRRSTRGVLELSNLFLGKSQPPTQSFLNFSSLEVVMQVEAISPKSAPIFDTCLLKIRARVARSSAQEEPMKASAPSNVHGLGTDIGTDIGHGSVKKNSSREDTLETPPPIHPHSVNQLIVESDDDEDGFVNMVMERVESSHL